MMMLTRCAVWAVVVTVAIGAVLIMGCGGGGGTPAPPPAPSGTVQGTLVYAATGQPLGDVTVAVQGTNLTTTTGADGSFTLRNVPVGAQVLIITADPDRDLVLPPGSTPIQVNVVQNQTFTVANILLIDGTDAPPAAPN